MSVLIRVKTRVLMNEIERKMSETVQSKLLAEMKSVWKIKGDLSMDDDFQPLGYTVREYVQKLFKIRDFD